MKINEKSMKINGKSMKINGKSMEIHDMATRSQIWHILRSDATLTAPSAAGSEYFLLNPVLK